MKFHVDGVAQGETTVFAFVRMGRPGNIIEFAHNVIPSAEPAWILTLGWTLSPEHEGALSRRTVAEPAAAALGRALSHRKLGRAMAFALSAFGNFSGARAAHSTCPVQAALRFPIFGGPTRGRSYLSYRPAGLFELPSRPSGASANRLSSCDGVPS